MLGNFGRMTQLRTAVRDRHLIPERGTMRARLNFLVREFTAEGG